MATVIDIGTLIVRTPEVRGGRPRVAGKGKRRDESEETRDRLGGSHLSPLTSHLSPLTSLPSSIVHHVQIRET